MELKHPHDYTPDQLMILGYGTAAGLPRVGAILAQESTWRDTSPDFEAARRLIDGFRQWIDEQRNQPAESAAKED